MLILYKKTIVCAIRDVKNIIRNRVEIYIKMRRAFLGKGEKHECSYYRRT